MFRIKKKNLFTICCIMLIIAGIIISMFIPKVKAETLGIDIDSYTDSDFLQILQNVKIDEYSNDLYPLASNIIYKTDTKRFELSVSLDDYITQIIPKQLFKTAGETLHIGREYGFFIKTYLDFSSKNLISDVLVFDIRTETELEETIDNLVVEVKPLFQYNYIYLKNGTTQFNAKSRNDDTYITVHCSIGSADGNIVRMPVGFVALGADEAKRVVYGQLDKYYLKDISFAGTIQNEQHLNEINGDYYDPYDDYGSYFVTQNYNYKGKQKRSGQAVSPSETGSLLLSNASFIMGFFDRFDIVGEIVDILQLVGDNIQYAVNLANTLLPENIENAEYNFKVTNNFFHRRDQLLAYNHLTKSASAIINTGGDSVWYGVDDYATAYFGVNHGTEGAMKPNYSRFNREIALKVVDTTEELAVVGKSSYDFQFREKVYEELSADSSARAVVLENGINYYSFTPVRSGYYLFTTTGAKSTDLSFENLSQYEKTTINGQNTKIRAYLVGGQTYRLNATLKAKDDFGMFDISVQLEELQEDTPINMTINSNNMDGTLFKIANSRNGAFKIFTSNSNIYFEILDVNFNIISSSTGNEIHEYMTTGNTYYLRIKSKSSSAQTFTVTMNNAEELNEDIEYSMAPHTDMKYYKLTASDSGYHTILIDENSATPYFLIQGFASSAISSSSGNATSLFLHMNAGQQIYIGLKNSSSFKFKFSKTQNMVKWEIDGKEISGNTVSLTRGSQTVVKVKIGDNYFNDKIYSPNSSYINFSNNTLIIQDNCTVSSSLDAMPFIYLTFINSEIPYMLNVFVKHNLNVSFDKYSDQYNYGFNWQTFSNITTEAVDIIYTLKTGNGGEVMRTLTTKRGASYYSIMTFVQTNMGYSGYEDVIFSIQKLVFKNNNKNVPIYNTKWEGFNGLSELEKMQNFTADNILINPYFHDGAGTDASPYTISCMRHFKNLERITYYDDGYNFFGKYNYKLLNSLSISGNWTPMGATSSHMFTGVLDGNGYSIDNMRISISTYGDYGLFRLSSGKIKNLTLKNVNITGSSPNPSISSAIGAFCGGTAAGELDNCHVYGNINVTGANISVGGLVGSSRSSIKNSTNNATITGRNSTGGIVGISRSYIYNCKNYGTINGDDRTGGIAGYSYETIENCTNSASINFTWVTINAERNNAGGILGEGYRGLVMYCENRGTIYYRNASNNSSILCPRIGQIIGFGYETSYGMNTTNGYVNKGTLKMITVNIGGSSYLHDQAAYAQNRANGYMYFSD